MWPRSGAASRCWPSWPRPASGDVPRQGGRLPLAESAVDSARHALEQLLYSMRRQLPQVVAPGSDPLRLDPAVLSTDIAEFTSRLAAGDLAGAAAIYRGPFLDGFFLSGAPEFERWAERERHGSPRSTSAYCASWPRRPSPRGDMPTRSTSSAGWRWRIPSASGRPPTWFAPWPRRATGWGGAGRARVRHPDPGGAAGSFHRDLEGLVERLHTEHRRKRVRRRRTPPVSRAVSRRARARPGSAAIVYLAQDRRYDRPWR